MNYEAIEATLVERRREASQERLVAAARRDANHVAPRLLDATLDRCSGLRRERPTVPPARQMVRRSRSMVSCQTP